MKTVYPTIQTVFLEKEKEYKEAVQANDKATQNHYKEVLSRDHTQEDIDQVSRDSRFWLDYLAFRYNR